jgi:hypothetical protein
MNSTVVDDKMTPAADMSPNGGNDCGTPPPILTKSPDRASFLGEKVQLDDVCATARTLQHGHPFVTPVSHNMDNLWFD